MHPLRNMLCCSFFVLLSVTSLAQKEYPATFLWRITGNGLQKPSYLYGTMHLQDRRLFYFGDSIYRAIESSEGFALEVNPNELVDSMFKNIKTKKNDLLLKDLMDEKTFRKVSKKLSKKYDIPADEITTDDLVRFRPKKRKERARKDDMQTFMDMYLYGIASRQGKQLSGIEDVSDQLGITDELGKLDFDEYLGDNGRSADYLETMKEIYLRRSLNEVNKMVSGYSEKYKDILLLKRNIKMSTRIDSLAHLRNSFFAVGVAHLAGEGGLIGLLEQKGFILSPVFSSAYPAPEVYKQVAAERNWLTVSDTNNICTVSMPGKPGIINVDEILPLKMYMDLGDMKFYGMAVQVISPEEAAADSLFTQNEKSYKRSGMKVLRKTFITYENARGVEFMTSKEEGKYYYRYRLLREKNRTAMLVFGAQNEQALNSPEAEKFFSSLKFNAEDTGSKEEMLINERNAFAVQFPGKPLKIPSSKTADNSILAESYMASDPSTGNYYMMQVITPLAGYFFEDDSAYFEGYKKQMIAATKNGLEKFNYEYFNGLPGASFSAVKEEKGLNFLMTGRLIRRDSRVYVMMVITPEERGTDTGINRFFQSFKTSAYKNAGWSVQTATGPGTIIYAPGDITVKEPAEAETDSTDNLTYNSFDENTGISYSLNVKKISPLYWINSDSAYFKQQAQSYTGARDSIVSYSYVKGNYRKADALVKIGTSKVYKKIKFMLNGGKLYTFYSYLPEAMLGNAEANRYFDSARFIKDEAVTLFSNKSAELLKALKSSDSATVEEAVDILSDIHFEEKDLPFLYEAFLIPFKNNSGFNPPVSRIRYKISGITPNPGLIKFAEENYSTVQKYPDDRALNMLTLPAENKTTESYRLLQRLLLSPPLHGDYIFPLIESMSDSLLLTRNFFPRLGVLYSDTVLGSGLVHIAAALLDSGYAVADSVLVNEEGVRTLAEKYLQSVKQDQDAYPLYLSDVLTLTGRFNTERGNNLLKEFVQVPTIWIKRLAVLALLKNRVELPAAEIKKLAADKNQRSTFYEDLKKIGRTDLFPKSYYTPERFAESYLAREAENKYDYIVKDMDKIGQRTVTVKGAAKTFFLFKIKIEEEGDISYHLGICGAFADKPDLATDDYHVTIIWDVFEKNAVNKNFDSFIKEINDGPAPE